MKVEVNDCGRIVEMRDMKDGEIGRLLDGEILDGSPVVIASGQRNDTLLPLTVLALNQDGTVDRWSDASENTLRVRPLPPGSKITITV